MEIIKVNIVTDEIKRLDNLFDCLFQAQSDSISDRIVNSINDTRIYTDIAHVPKAVNIDRTHFDLSHSEHDFMENDLPIILEKMAQMGWSNPPFMTLFSLKKIGELVFTTEVIDKVFDSVYTINDNAELREVIDLIIKKQEANWNELIEECYDSFVRGKYSCIVPTLFTILEGYLSRVFGVDEHKDVGKDTKKAKYNHVNLKKDPYKEYFEAPALFLYFNSIRNNYPSKFSDIFLENKHRVDKDRFRSTATNSKSIQIVIENFYENSNGFSVKPTDLKRHWIMHGRQTAPNPKINALQLFNLIGSISICFENIVDFSDPDIYLKPFPSTFYKK